MTNIRKLKVLLSQRERELITCDPRSRDKVRVRRNVLRLALGIARESVQSRAEQSSPLVRSPEQRGAAV